MKLKTLACLTLIAFAASFASAKSPSSTSLVRSGASRSNDLIDWAQFNFDPAHDGYNPYETILNPANVGNITLKWSYAPAEGRVEVAPAVVNGVVYFATGYYPLSSGSTNPSDFNAIYAINADTGEFIWKYGIDTPSFGSPAVANGVVYVITGDYLHALDAVTGALIWQYEVYGSNYSSPTVANGIVYIASSDRHVYALNATTGAPIWSYATAGGIYVSPAVANGVLYVSSGPGIVYALNADTGALVWKKQFGNTIGPSPTLSGTQGGQAVANGVLYVEIQRKASTYDLYALDAGTGAPLWRAPVGGVTPAVAGGVVYVASGGLASALDASTGVLIWQSALTGGARSAVVANGVVYVGGWYPTGDNTGYGTIDALDASTGTMLWNYQSSRSGGYDIFPTPVVVNGTIYGSLISSGGNEVGAWGLPNQ